MTSHAIMVAVFNFFIHDKAVVPWQMRNSTLKIMAHYKARHLLLFVDCFCLYFVVYAYVN